MVYNFIFDVLLFDTHFSSMQYWGLFVTVITFVIDIYLTFRSDSSVDQEAIDKKNDDNERNQLLDSARTENSSYPSSRLSVRSSGDKPIFRNTDRPLYNNSLGGTGNTKQPSLQSTANSSSFDQEVDSTGRSPINQLLVSDMASSGETGNNRTRKQNGATTSENNRP